ncbi:Hypothetical protein SRAE_2000464200 [Strongyloides ratti]|uniref:Uncharacterized protein n=1 Tax=Strongyloides ratti TaxID=34506 RepID=A0A090LJV8_STRRB|nr:Hypothetical protein SRAE_2000464200 [Strongyloides ratti]CEF69998.1 Hypothetical protein SRAE_2000464200 [Strongyloides ratti]
MQDKRSIRARYKDISRIIFFNDYCQSSNDNEESLPQFPPSYCSESLRSINSTITMDSTISKCDSQVMINGSMAKVKKKTLFQKLSFTFSRSSSTTSDKIIENNRQKKEEDV